MSTIIDTVPKFTSIEINAKAVDAGGSITYNQAGITYNQAGNTYGGIYGLDGSQPKGNSFDIASKGNTKDLVSKGNAFDIISKANTIETRI